MPEDYIFDLLDLGWANFARRAALLLSKKGHQHDRKCSIFFPKSSEEQKKKTADVLFSPELK